jgi:sugar-specific transcriptional regulator TrmB
MPKIFQLGRVVAHYKLITQEIYESVGIKILPKEVDPPNVPQLSLIERFWASTDNIKTFIRRIRKIIRNRPENLCQNLMKRVKTKVRTAADRGVLSVIN